MQQEWRYVGRGKTRDSTGMRLARKSRNGEWERLVKSMARTMRVPPGTKISIANRRPTILTMRSARFITSVPSSGFAYDVPVMRSGLLDPEVTLDLALLVLWPCRRRAKPSSKVDGGSRPPRRDCRCAITARNR